MKKLWLLILPLFILACNESTSVKQKAEEQHESSTPKVLSAQKSKWKLDENTKVNIGAMKSVMADSITIKQKGYPALADNLQQKLNKLLSECRMTGEDHQALHHWLETFIGDMKGLKEKGKGEAAYASLKKDLEQFDQSFE